MTPVEILTQAKTEKFTWVDYSIDDEPFNADEEEGSTTELELLPGLSEDEIDEFTKSLPHPPPAEIRMLLSLAAGFNISSDEVRFNAYNDWGYEFLLPHVVVLNGDGRGNSWVIEVNWKTGQWEHVWFECHDPPVLVYQCASLSEYIDAVLDNYRFEKCVAGHRSILYYVDDQSFRVWEQRRGLPEAGSLKESDDPVLAEFAGGIHARTKVADLRSPNLGDGFDWAPLASGDQPVKRAGTELLFGVEPRRGLLSRLFGR